MVLGFFSFGFWVLGFGFWVLGFGFWVLVQGLRARVQGIKLWDLWFEEKGLREIG